LKKRLLFIINPASGTADKTSFVVALHDYFRHTDFEYEVVLTEKAGDAALFSKKAADENFFAVTAVGGDGTVNETASGLIHTQTALFIAPYGSGNGLARHLNYPLNNLKALFDILKNGKTRQIDAAQVNNRCFFATAGVGFDALVAHEFAKEKERGFKQYAKKVLKLLGSYQPISYKIKYNGSTTETWSFILTVCNTSEYGNGAKINPSSIDNDNLLDVCQIKAANTLSLAFSGLDIMRGNIEKNKLFNKFSASEITIETDELCPLHIDGEPLAPANQFTFTTLPSALFVLTT
jgi:YegS/Rv2252/BmrU family lipid kinase